MSRFQRRFKNVAKKSEKILFINKSHVVTFLESPQQTYNNHSIATLLNIAKKGRCKFFVYTNVFWVFNDILQTSYKPKFLVLSFVYDGDSLVVISTLNNKKESLASFGYFLEAVLPSLASFSSVSFSHVCRVGNNLAHNLTKYVRHVRGLRVWMEDVSISTPCHSCSRPWLIFPFFINKISISCFTKKKKKKKKQRLVINIFNANVDHCFFNRFLFINSNPSS